MLGPEAHEQLGLLNGIVERIVSVASHRAELGWQVTLAGAAKRRALARPEEGLHVKAG